MIDELVKRTVALSQAYRRAANALSIVQKAMDVNNAATHQLADGVRGLLDAVEKDTATLTAKLGALAKTEDLISLSLKILVAMGAIALAVLAPNPASIGAATLAVGDAVQGGLS